MQTSAQKLKSYGIVLLAALLLSGPEPSIQQTKDLSSLNMVLKPTVSQKAYDSVINSPVLAIISSPNEKSQSCTGDWACSEKKQDLRYENCKATDPNGYLENQLAEGRNKFEIIRRMTPANESDSTNQTQLISRQCVRAAMDRAFFSKEKKSLFKKCSNPSGSLQQASRPCVSQNYFDSINKGFDLVNQCMKDYILPGADNQIQKQMTYSIFKMVTFESGFHMNVKSSSGSTGLGQLTSGAIIDVNARIPTIKKQLEQSKSENCRLIATDLLKEKVPMKPNQSTSCERISPDKGNPLLNLLYTFSYFKLARDFVKNSVSSYKDQLSALNRNDKENFLSDLASWAHNTGPSGMTKPLIALLNVYKMNGKKVTDTKKFLKELESMAYNAPHRANSGSNRRIETSQYFRKMQEATALIEKNLGVKSCLQN